jgi:hypothetical protein
MQRYLSSLLIVAAGVAAGCGAAHHPPASAPVAERVEAVSPENADALRAAYAQQFPGSQLGVVVAAINHRNGHFVSVGGMKLDRIEDGDPVTFIDANQYPLANGVIVNVLSDQVHVRVDEPTIRRQPQVGDMMFYRP